MSLARAVLEGTYMMLEMRGGPERGRLSGNPLPPETEEETTIRLCSHEAAIAIELE